MSLMSPCVCSPHEESLKPVDQVEIAPVDRLKDFGSGLGGLPVLQIISRVIVSVA